MGLTNILQIQKHFMGNSQLNMVLKHILHQTNLDLLPFPKK